MSKINKKKLIEHIENFNFKELFVAELGWSSIKNPSRINIKIDKGDINAQHSTAQHSTAQHSTAQHSTAQHSTAQHSTAGADC